MRLFLALAILAALGCAAKKPLLEHPAAQLVIPVNCIDGVIGGTKDVRCEQLPNDPTKAKCTGGVIVKFHCTKSLVK